MDSTVERFYFSKDILSDEHTKDVSYRRTESRCGPIIIFSLRIKYFQGINPFFLRLEEGDLPSGFC
jgi:hypothetical protein